MATRRTGSPTRGSARRRRLGHGPLEPGTATLPTGSDGRDRSVDADAQRDARPDRESVERQRLFVAMASHELRAPLAALRAELDDADRDDTSLAEYRQAVQDAHGDVIRLSSLVTSLLELAATQEDARQVERRRSASARSSLPSPAASDPLVRQRGAAIGIDVPDVVVRVDRARVERALGNLVDNALTYGGSGTKVEVRCRIDGESGARTLTFEVSRPRARASAPTRPVELFEPFVRGAQADGLRIGPRAGHRRAARSAPWRGVRSRQPGRRRSTVLVQHPGRRRGPLGTGDRDGATAAQSLSRAWTRAHRTSQARARGPVRSQSPPIRSAAGRCPLSLRLNLVKRPLLTAG